MTTLQDASSIISSPQACQCVAYVSNIEPISLHSLVGTSG